MLWNEFQSPLETIPPLNILKNALQCKMNEPCCCFNIFLFLMNLFALFRIYYVCWLCEILVWPSWPGDLF